MKQHYFYKKKKYKNVERLKDFLSRIKYLKSVGLNEREIGDIYGVSRQSVNEVLKKVKDETFVIITDNDYSSGTDKNINLSKFNV